MAEQECHILAGNFAKAVQVLLGMMTLGVLYLKYKRDPGGRNVWMFSLDSSKQIFAVGWLHVLNAATALLLGWLKLKSADECSWYWVEIMIDTTLGVLVEYVLLQCLPQALCGEDRALELTTGNYFDEQGQFDIVSYTKQLFFWLLIVSIMKLFMVILMVIGSPVLLEIARVVLNRTYGSPNLELLVVMVLTPGIMNSVQFWLVDNIFVHQRHYGEEVEGAPQYYTPEDSRRGPVPGRYQRMDSREDGGGTGISPKRAIRNYIPTTWKKGGNAEAAGATTSSGPAKAEHGCGVA